MDRTWILGYLCGFVLVLSCNALEGHPDIYQRELDLSELLMGDRELGEDTPDFSQREITHEIPLDVLRALGIHGSSPSGSVQSHGFSPRGPSPFRPRSMGPYVPFPPGRPTPDNLLAICRYGNRRPRYTRESLPQNGFGHLTRQADAINRAELWYGGCCQGNSSHGDEGTLCCAEQAWKQSLSAFCEEEFSIKTRHYHCCKERTEQAKWECFSRDAPNPSYQADAHVPQLSQMSQITIIPQDLSFKWNPNVCPKYESVLSLRSLKRGGNKVVDIDFPPGRPDASNIEHVCGGRKTRPLYLVKCLPRRGYGWLARQSKAMNRMERQFKLCCKDSADKLTCAEQKWREVMDMFCQEEEKATGPEFECCKQVQGEERYACFSARAPQPAYFRQEMVLSVQSTPQSPAMLCNTHRNIKKRSLLPFPVNKIVRSCCHPAGNRKSACVVEKLDSMQQAMCSGREPLPAQVDASCCQKNQEDSPKCLTEMVMRAIAKATESKGFRKRKCALS
ncbi:extracellular matrix protein 1 [Chanos chanos]|uniref:Extracellular matrix protein 1 n=1 Tax=Chanos chanos TaxID=29144 RepID=A0A6J2WAQ1_CHACN|nr:extracellular matrix protein 1 [Chanos chanos]